LVDGVQLGPYLPYLFSGLYDTLLLTAGGLALGFVLGIMLAFVEMYLPRPLSSVASAVEQVLRGIPLIVMFFLIYFGFPSLGLVLPPEAAASLGLGLRSAGYQSQIFRSTLGSIGMGQVEAALSIGLGKFATYREVLLPQAVRLSIPAWSNEFTVVLKDTSMAYAIGVAELLKRAANVVALTLDALQVYLIIAAIYFVATFAVSRGMNLLYKRWRVPGLGGGG
jgi:polar amino acid transport system permease protein